MAKIPLWRYSAVPITPSPVTGSPIARPSFVVVAPVAPMPELVVPFSLGRRGTSRMFHRARPRRDRRSHMFILEMSRGGDQQRY